MRMQDSRPSTDQEEESKGPSKKRKLHEAFSNHSPKKSIKKLKRNQHVETADGDTYIKPNVSTSLLDGIEEVNERSSKEGMGQGEEPYQMKQGGVFLN